MIVTKRINSFFIIPQLMNNALNSSAIIEDDQITRTVPVTNVAGPAVVLIRR